MDIINKGYSKVQFYCLFKHYRMKISHFALLVLMGYVNISVATLPVQLPQVTGNSSEQCTREFASKLATTSTIQDAIVNVVNPELNKFGRVCDCGGPGWTQVANIKMSDPSQQCPDN